MEMLLDQQMSIFASLTNGNIPNMTDANLTKLFVSGCTRVIQKNCLRSTDAQILLSLCIRVFYLKRLRSRAAEIRAARHLLQPLKPRHVASREWLTEFWIYYNLKTRHLNVLLAINGAPVFEIHSHFLHGT